MYKSTLMKSNVLIVLAISLIFSLSLTAQQKTNVEKLNQLSAQFSQDWALKQAKVIEYAANNNLQIRIEGENGKIIQMVDVVDGILPPLVVHAEGDIDDLGFDPSQSAGFFNMSSKLI